MSKGLFRSPLHFLTHLVGRKPWPWRFCAPIVTGFYSCHPPSCRTRYHNSRAFLHGGSHTTHTQHGMFLFKTSKGPVVLAQDQKTPSNAHPTREQQQEQELYPAPSSLTLAQCIVTGEEITKWSQVYTRCLFTQRAVDGANGPWDPQVTVVYQKSVDGSGKRACRKKRVCRRVRNERKRKQSPRLPGK